MGLAVVISGPRECGKSKLIRAVRRNHPELSERMRTIPMYNSRRPFADEKEGELWFFRQKQQIEQLASEGKVIAWPMRQGNVIGVDPQMIAEAAMERDSIVMVRVASAIGSQLAGHPALKGTALRSVFLSPISMADIAHFKERGANTPDKLQYAVVEYIRDRIRSSIYMARKVNEDIATFMGIGVNDAFEELLNAPFFTDVLVNPEIMGGDQWLADKMPESAEKMFRSFVAILQGEKDGLSETWPHDLLVGRSREEQIRANFRPRSFGLG